MSDESAGRTVPEEVAQLTFGTWRRQKGWKPFHIVDAEGCWFTDADGKRYLDFSSQAICTQLGHKNQAVIKAIADQAQQLPYVAPAFATDVRAKLARLLTEVLPKGLTKFFFSTSGTEANEAAIKIARMYTGKYKVISRYTSYHGATAGSIALTGDYRRWPVEPMGKMGGGVFAPDANCRRCPFGMKHPDCGVACVNYIDYMIEHESNVAAVIVEPIVGTNGVILPPGDYLPRLSALCKKHKVLLIADEIMTGWGRTGAWFAVDHWGVVPDILTTAKGITSAYAPLGLTATTREIADFFDDNLFAHGHTYESHALTLAPAVAAIGEYRRLGLIERSKEMGEYLGTRLRELAERHPSVGDVRGLGLFYAVELVREKGTTKPFNTMRDRMEGKRLLLDQMQAELWKRGVSCLGWISHLVLAPPLIVTKEEIDIAIKALDEVLAIADAAQASA